MGGGIVEIIEQRRAQLEAATGGVGLQVKSVVVRDKNKPRDWALPPGCSITESFDDVLEDDEIDIVIEVIGGTTLARVRPPRSPPPTAFLACRTFASIANCRCMGASPPPPSFSLLRLLDLDDFLELLLLPPPSAAAAAATAAVIVVIWESF